MSGESKRDRVQKSILGGSRNARKFQPAEGRADFPGPIPIWIDLLVVNQLPLRAELLLCLGGGCGDDGLHFPDDDSADFWGS